MEDAVDIYPVVDEEEHVENVEEGEGHQGEGEGEGVEGEGEGHVSRPRRRRNFFPHTQSG
jgi:hypothetical protein